MGWYNKFKNKMELKGGSLRNENIRNTKLLIEEVFKDDASLMQNIFLWHLGLIDKNDYEKETSIVIRFFNRKFSNANGVMVNFQTLSDTPIVVGDILYDSDTNEYWLCTEAFNIDTIHYEGKLTLCNWILKWQKKDGTILKYPCVDINATQYNSGEMSNKQFTVGSSQHMVTLPYDENTVRLKTPQRFMLDRNTENPTVFMVTQNDTTSYGYGTKGLVKVTLYENEFNAEKDRVDLGVCDYISDDDIATDNDTGIEEVAKSVISYTTRVIKSGGDMQTFVGKFYDAEGKEITDVSAHWEIVCEFLNELDIVEENNTISIGIDDDRFIDEELRLILSDASGQSASSLLITIQSLL